MISNQLQVDHSSWQTFSAQITGTYVRVHVRDLIPMFTARVTILQRKLLPVEHKIAEKLFYAKEHKLHHHQDGFYLCRRTQTIPPKWNFFSVSDTRKYVTHEVSVCIICRGITWIRFDIREWRCVYLDLTHFDTFWPWFLVHPESATKRRMLVTTSRLIHFVILSECDDVVFTLTQQHLDTSWPWFL